jgi:hypothetical protein
MIRNLALVGHWRGGNNTGAVKPLASFLSETFSLWYHLILVNDSMTQLLIPTVLVLIGLTGLAFAWFRTQAAARLVSLREMFSSLYRLQDRQIFLVYSAAIAFISLRSVISYRPRMYVPVLPHFIALLACTVAWVIQRIPRGMYCPDGLRNGVVPVGWLRCR